MVLDFYKLLTDSNIEQIAVSVSVVCESDEANFAIDNLWKALEKDQNIDIITQRIEKRQKEIDTPAQSMRVLIHAHVPVVENCTLPPRTRNYILRMCASVERF